MLRNLILAFCHRYYIYRITPRKDHGLSLCDNHFYHRLPCLTLKISFSRKMSDSESRSRTGPGAGGSDSPVLIVENVPRSTPEGDTGVSGSSKTSPSLGNEAQQKRRVTRDFMVQDEKEKFLNMSLEEKRKLYKCGDGFFTLEDVLTWPEYQQSLKDKQKIPVRKHEPGFEVDREINQRVSIWRGDITKLEIDAVVNAANNSLLGGGGVDGAIHSAAGRNLKKECATLHGCDTGEAKITAGYNLPAKYVIHTVGPIGEKRALLKRAYVNCLKLVKEHSIKSVAFPCISTGIYGYPNHKAVHVALETARRFLEHVDLEKIDRVIFCLFLSADVKLYEELLPKYFPLEPFEPKLSSSDDEESKSTKEKKDGISETSESDEIQTVANENIKSSDDKSSSESTTEKSDQESSDHPMLGKDAEVIQIDSDNDRLDSKE